MANEINQYSVHKINNAVKSWNMSATHPGDIEYLGGNYFLAVDTSARPDVVNLLYRKSSTGDFIIVKTIYSASSSTDNLYGVTWDGKFIYIIHKSGLTSAFSLYQIDIKSGKLVRTHSFPNSLQKYGLCTDGKYLYYLLVFINFSWIYQYDLATDTEVKFTAALSGGNRVRSLAFDGKKFYVLEDTSSGTFSDIIITNRDGKTLKKHVSKGTRAEGICFDGKYLYTLYE